LTQPPATSAPGWQNNQPIAAKDFLTDFDYLPDILDFLKPSI
jgi:hypothetical protein